MLLGSHMLSFMITRPCVTLVRMHPDYERRFRINKACMRETRWYEGRWSEEETTVLWSLGFGVGVFHDRSLGRAAAAEEFDPSN